ncbi:hypothetical protein DH2020_014647 [Rehmannia glutinosa]|uniref:N-acetyltransferase domain-containing protein n=1 Tax=Rehmannia glutinosa TaxID=99300 RepID=A0ABR0WX11_REHGL
MSTIAVQRPDFSRTWGYGKRGYRISSSWTMSTPARKEKEFPGQLQKLSIPENDKFISPSNFKFDRLQLTDQVANHGDTAEFEHFVAREARLDEEYWTAAWLRAESHWEGREHDSYEHSYFSIVQEFNAMKKRYSTQFGEKCKCIVMVKKEDTNVRRSILKNVVGTLDLSIRYLSHGETFPGERVKPPLFCLINGKSSSSYGYIANLCIAKSARRQGIASSMLQFAVVSAKAQVVPGAEKVFVHVYRYNKAAQGLYQKMGFEVVDAPTSQFFVDQTYLLCLENLQTS